jgi:hypothetical protein
MIQGLTNAASTARKMSESKIPLLLKELAWGSATCLTCALSLNDDSQVEGDRQKTQGGGESEQEQ